MTPYEVIDPRPIAASAPYTFFLPNAQAIAAAGVGDLVKAIYRAVPPSEDHGAERMWVKVTSAGDEWVEGILDSKPADMPNLPLGSAIRLPRSYIIDVIFNDADKAVLASAQPRREYWERCLVDQCVLNGERKVGYIYREEPDMTKEGDRFPDSGWRIRGDMRGEPKEELEPREVAYVALGAVLNRDNSWLHLIDEPVGASFDKDFEKDAFIQETQ